MKRAVSWGIAAVAVAGLAHAEPRTADELAAEGAKRATAGDYVHAAAAFEQAYAIDPRPELICNTGVAYRKAGDQLPRAQLYLARCIERGTALDPKFMASIRTALGAVETALRAGAFTPVDILVEPSGAQILIAEWSADEVIVGSRVVWLAAGKHSLTARAEGYGEKTIEIEATGHDRQPVKIQLERVPAVAETGSGSGSASESGSAAGSESGSGSGSASVVVAVPVSESGPSVLPPIATTAATIALGVVSFLAYRDAHDRAGLAPYAISDAVYADDKSAIDRSNTIFAVTGAAAVVGAGISAYLWIRVARGPSPIAVEPHGDGATVSLTGRW